MENYKKIEIAMSIINNGGKFIACNKDKYFPFDNNKLVPACGAMVAAIAEVSNKTPDFIVGKPNTYILSIIQEKYNINNKDIVVVGDSYENDIIMAINNRSKAILVNSRNRFSSNNYLILENLIETLRYLQKP